MHRITKGQYGYIAYQKKFTLIRTLIYFALCAAVFIIGFVTTGTRRNLLTIVAVLGCLPAAKSLVNTIMFMRAKGCDPDTHDLIEKAMEKAGSASEESGKGIGTAYDLYMTSYNTNYPISHLAVCGNMITGLIPGAGTDVTNACEKHMEEQLKMGGISGMTIKIFGDTPKYVARLEKLGELEAAEHSAPVSVLDTLRSISL